jgi:2-dehydro-3-deoxygalactonokinase
MGEIYDAKEATLIALDWGTSTLRAYLLAADGRVLSSREGSDGILSANPNFEKVFIGSRQGWFEVPYVTLPAGLHELSKCVAKHQTSTGQSLMFVAGVQSPSESEFPDVMRGEETQIIGATPRTESNSLFVLPGTHSKWVKVEQGRILDFRTFMTGELFSVLRSHSILGRLIQGEIHDVTAFERGVSVSAERANGSVVGIMASLFSVRSLGLFNQISGASLGSYLSGLLIGAEIRECIGLGFLTERSTPILIGSPDLCNRYREALSIHGVHSEIELSEAAPAGLLSIARHAGVCT